MSSDLASRVLSVLRACHQGREQVSLHEPCFGGRENDYLRECIDSGWVSSVGTFVDRFEQMLADYTGVRRAIAVVNGTAALHCCLRLIGVRQDDEVLVPALTFVATANAVAYCGAVPHFIDSSDATLGLDPGKLGDHLKEIATVTADGCRNNRTGRRISAVIPMHTFGHPVDMDPLVDVCKRYRLELVEDAAESLGSFYKDRHTGSWGRVSALSFNGNKILTTGGGGAILTNDTALADRAKHLTTTARTQHPWEISHDAVGFNYRLPNLNAALGCAQMEQLPGFVANKRSLAERYRQAFQGMAGIRLFTEPAFAKSNYWLNVLLLEKENAFERDRILELTRTSGMMTRPAWNLMPTLPMYKECPRMDLSTAESIASRLINIPSSAFL